MLMIVDGAFLIQGYITVNHAASEAARFAAVYQPPQGECLNRDVMGGPILEPWPYCPSDYAENPNEGDDNYYRRRVELIKRVALEATNGLRTDTVCKALDCIKDHYAESGMVGVRVWGFQEFDSNEEEDMPGVPGLPVRVQVTHNVPLVVFGSFLPNAMVRVNSAAEMINEGIQVGFGNQPPPTFGAAPAPIPPGTAVATRTPAPTGVVPTAGPSPTPTPRPVYHLDLTPKQALNRLPDEREHMLVAHVTDDLGANVAGARVSFYSDEASFELSGVNGNLTIETTDANGEARAVLYTNEPVTATIQAWIDYNGNGVVDTGEPSDSAMKVWEALGSYLVVSRHNVEPLEYLSVAMRDHPASGNPHSLWWCPQTVTATQVIQQLAYPLDVDGAGNLTDIPIQVPVGVAGRYRIESHRGDGGGDGCADAGTLVAYSSPIEIAETPPDLVIDDVILPPEEKLAPGVPITLEIHLRNTAPVAVTTGPFDVDVYLDQDTPPQVQQLGIVKQWQGNLGPLETAVITTYVTVYEAEDHKLWVQVDTTDYVPEGDTGGEDNNVFGPLHLPLSDCIPLPGYSDDFDGGMHAAWQSLSFDNANGSHNVTGDQLEITSRGGSLWGGGNSYHFIYQEYTGDFDARLRIIQEPTTNQWAKVGLHVLQDPSDDRTPFVMNMATHYRNPMGEQAAYRDGYGSTPNRTSNSNNATIAQPSWLRIVRDGNSYAFYRSDVDDPTTEDDWVLQGTHTAPNAYNYVGIAHASYSSSYGTGIVDDFEMCRPTKFSDVPPPDESIYPPGLEQCAELISVPGFEGNPATVFSYWNAGATNGIDGAYQRQSAEFYRGSFSLRLHASNTIIPCSVNQPQPYLYQEVEFPTDVFSQSTLTVSGFYRITDSSFTCSLDDAPDADDRLSVGLRALDGTEITPPQEVLNGGAATGQWHPISINLHDHLANPADYAGETLRLQWDALNDRDIEGTFFYIDELSAQLCTAWAIPPDQPDTATVGGKITTRGENNVPTALPGTDVWAYAQGGAVLHTRSIQEGKYNFYNITPGTYVIYAEAWVGGELRTVMTTVTLGADERNYGINLLLQ
jgi:hypothetical protein